MLDFNNIEEKSSFVPIRPGVSVKVKLEKVEITEEGHLDFHFKGLDVDNAGNFKPRFWADALDPDKNQNYDADNAKNTMRQINCILKAFLPEDVKKTIKGASTAELYHNIARNLTPQYFEGVEAAMKIVYKKDSDSICVIPRYYDFISTALNPVALSINESKVDANKIPYDRILPLSHYNVVPQTGSDMPVAFDAPANTTEDSTFVPFGS